MVAMWAKRYINLYRNSGSDEAKKWAIRFLDGPSRQRMITKVNEILNKNKKKG